MSVYEYSVKDKSGNDISMEPFKDQVLVIVNVASKCGSTPQYEGLEALYKEYKDKGFSIIGVESNQFLEQEPGNNDEIQSFCKLNYGVIFPVMGKADVRGSNAIPLFNYLTSRQAFKGFTGEKAAFMDFFLQKEFPEFLGDDSGKWNFTKFVVNRKGEVV